MSVRVNSSNIKDRKVYTFDNFRGVDFSTSPYKVNQTRAIHAENLIYDNGVVRKRNGWQCVCDLKERINGIYSFEIENEQIILAYAGTKFYRLTKNEKLNRFDYVDITNTCQYMPANLDTSRLIDRRIQVYVNKNKAYIVGCGDYLVFGKWGADFELRRVYDNEDTYIPTTTINIDNDAVDDVASVEFDGVNILSSYRINRLLGVDSSEAQWTLDTAIQGETQAIDADSDIHIELYTLDESNNRVMYTIVNNYESDKTKLYYRGEDVFDEPVGEVSFEKGIITLYRNTKPQITDESNIYVKFRKSDSYLSDLISSATLSVIFGGGGNSNRLFVSGIKDRKNIHLWSDIYDYTYFDTNNYDEFGSDSGTIMGYVRATDGVLLVFKEKTGSDATIYYVNGADTEDEDVLGNKVFVTKFYKFAGDCNDTIYSSYGTANLNGDNLVLTKNGVKGIEIYENISTNAYRMRERSRNINAKLLKQEGLSDACGYVFNDKYYLSMDGVTYVCDSRFPFSSEADIGDSYNYEWWYFTNVDARVWCEIDGNLCFGTNTGLICQFIENNFADITYQDTDSSVDLTINYETNKFTFNSILNGALDISTSIQFLRDNIFALHLNSEEIVSIDEDGWLYFDEKSLSKVYEGVVCFADNVGDSGLQVNIPYTIGFVDLDNLRFKLINEHNEQVAPRSVGFTLCKNVSKKTLYLDNIDTANAEFQVKEYPNGDILDIVSYNATIPTGISATIWFKENIRACWFTPICDLGTNMYSKTLLGLTIATEPLIKGTVSVGYQTRNIDKDFATYGSSGFDFNNIDFENFSFESSFTSSYTVRVKERNFNFIVLRYVSDDQNACAVNGITIRYKINRLNKGVR